MNTKKNGKKEKEKQKRVKQMGFFTQELNNFVEKEEAVRSEGGG